MATNLTTSLNIDGTTYDLGDAEARTALDTKTTFLIRNLGANETVTLTFQRPNLMSACLVISDRGGAYIVCSSARGVFQLSQNVGYLSITQTNANTASVKNTHTNAGTAVYVIGAGAISMS